MLEIVEFYPQHAFPSSLVPMSKCRFAEIFIHRNVLERRVCMITIENAKNSIRDIRHHEFGSCNCHHVLVLVSFYQKSITHCVLKVGLHIHFLIDRVCQRRGFEKCGIHELSLGNCPLAL